GSAGGGSAGGGSAGGDASGGGTSASGGGGPGLYGCACGTTPASGGTTALMLGVAFLLAAARRRVSGALALVVLLGVPLSARAAESGATAAVVERVKIAVLPVQAGPGVKPELAEILTDAIASALATHRDLSVISQRDLVARLGFERQRQLVSSGSGCAEDTSCMAEIGNALGVDKLVFGSAARVGSSAVLSTTVLTLGGSEVERHTERVKSLSEEAFLDAISPTVAALFPAPAVAAAGQRGSEPAVAATATEAPSELDGATFGLTVRGQLAPMFLPSGAWVVHADYLFSEQFSAGVGAIIARPFGVMARGAWVPFNASGRLRPIVAVEVPVMFAPGGPAVGLGGALGFEARLLKQLAVGAEIPLSYYLGGPSTLQRFWVFGALTVTGRL
ncbi:MAG: hypothetical protein K1X89_29860, partial [Myxococcaceae bacterium]|nr:hypothetical protein [Myxococcaceae bacterium]